MLPWVAPATLAETAGDEQHTGPLRLFVPNLTSIDVAAAALTGLAMVAMFRFKLSLPKTLGMSAALGLVWKLLLDGVAPS